MSDDIVCRNSTPGAFGLQGSMPWDAMKDDFKWKSLPSPRRLSWHSAHKAARILIFYQRKPNAHMTASWPWACEMVRHFVQANITVIDFYEKLNGALHPGVQTSLASRLDNHRVVQISEGGIFKPAHQKSSAEGIRL